MDGKWLEVNEHIWKKNDSGESDEWAWEYGYHNGVTCLVCGISHCVHCVPHWEKTKCKIITYRCSKCNAHKIEKSNFCPECGADMREEVQE